MSKSVKSVIIFVALAIFSWLAYKVKDGHIFAIDKKGVELANKVVGTPIYDIAMFFTHLGSTKGIVAMLVTLMAFAVWRFRSWKLPVAMLIAVGGSAVLTSVIKNAIERERPSINEAVYATGFSFPSGHAFSGIVFYLTVAIVLHYAIKSAVGRKLLWTSMLILPLVTASSRVLLKAHYVTDVTAGLLIGAAWFLVVHFFWPKVN